MATAPIARSIKLEVHSWSGLAKADVHQRQQRVEAWRRRGM